MLWLHFYFFAGYLSRKKEVVYIGGNKHNNNKRRIIYSSLISRPINGIRDVLHYLRSKFFHLEKSFAKKYLTAKILKVQNGLSPIIFRFSL